MSDWRPPISARAILASAGSGKTFQLSNQYIGLLCRDVPVERVLATTFTRKAAGEILDRVLGRLAEAAASEEASRTLGAFIGSPLTAARSRDVLARFVRSMPLARIGTIDSFFSRLASAFEMDMELPIGWAIVSEEKRWAMVLEAVEATVEQAEESEIVPLLRSLHQGGYPSQVLPAVLRVVEDAHAASQKTTAESWGVVPRVPARGPMGEDECGAALRRLAETPAMAAGESKVHGTLAKARDAIVERVRTEKYLEAVGSQLAQAARVPSGTFAKKELSPALVAALRPVIEHAQCMAIAEVREANQAMRGLADRYDAQLRRLKQRTGQLAFDDVPRMLLAAHAVGNLDDLYYRLDSRIDHVLLDEFQDTSLEQFALLRPLMEEILGGGEGQIERSESTANAGRSIFLVGDVKQSMYAWRDAEPDLFGEVLSLWPQLQREQLHESRRSSQVVLDAVNAVFSSLSSNTAIKDNDREAAARWEAGFVRHTAAKDQPGCVRLHVVREPQEEEVASSIRIRTAADRIREITRRAPGASIGVLLPAKKHIARLIHELKEREVPASEEGGNPLTDSPAVAAVLSALQVIDHPGDRAARFHVATTPLGEHLGLLAWRNDEVARAFAARVRGEISRAGLGHVVREWRRAMAPRSGARDVLRLAQLVELAREHEVAGETRLRGFIDLVRTRRVESPNVERVRVMTIHKSKGLEFDAVVLPDLDAGMLRPDGLVMKRGGVLDPIEAVSRYPSEKARAISVELEEMYQQTRARNLRERLCVLYVAMTRARHALEIFVDAKSKATSPSYAQIVRCGLGVVSDLAGGQVGAEQGSDAWMAKFAAGVEGHATARPVRVELRPAEVSPTGRLEVVSPSTLRAPPGEDSAANASGDQEKEIRPREVAATRLGTLMHRALERIEWLDEGDARASAIVEALGLSSAVEERTTTNSLSVALSDPSVRRVLTHDRYAGWDADRLLLRREVRAGARLPELARDRECLFAGFVDRLVVGLRSGRAVAAEVIDFKSDTIEPGQIESRRERYAPQIDAYRRIIADQFELRESSVRGTLVFLGAGRVVSWP